MSETTDQQLNASASTEAQSDASSNESAQSLETNDSIPEKFVGKSTLDVIKSYNEIERSFHKASSERAEEAKKREALEQRIRDLESRTTIQKPLYEASPTQVTEEPDPFSDYDKRFEQDPKEAIKDLFTKSKAHAQAEARLAKLQMESQLANEYYNQQKLENPEFNKLEPTMLELAKEYGHLVSPEKVNSRAALKLLQLAAKGARISDYVEEAKAQAKKETSTVRDEKRQAFSESSNSKGEARKDFKDLSLAEMEKALGRVRY